jgi:hypothetical protein
MGMKTDAFILRDLEIDKPSELVKERKKVSL